MRLIFIDEFGGVVKKNLFGIGLVSVDATKYQIVCKKFNTILKNNNWDLNKELKGRYLFSRDAAGQSKTPEEMIKLVKELITSFAGKSNVRGNLISFFNVKGARAKNYRMLVSNAILKLPKNKSGGIKGLASVYFDNWDQILKPAEKKKLDQEVIFALNKRGYCLVEGVAQGVESSNRSPGIIYADILGYLSRWIIENPKSKELNLFDLIEGRPTINKKVTITREIFNLLKRSVIYKLK